MDLENEQVEELEPIEGEEVETTVDATEPEEEGDEESQAQSKSQGSKQRLKRKLRQEAERANQIAEENRILQEKLSTLETKVDSVLNPPAPRPSRVNFDTEEEYEDALLDWKIATPERKVAETKPQTPQGRPQIDSVVQENWENQLDDGHEKYPDFQAVISNPDVPITPAMSETVMSSEQGAEVAYFLGKNPDEAMKIARMSIASQVREIDKLAKRFATQTTKAPAPIKAVKGGDSPIKDASKMTPEEYRDHRRKQGMPR